MLKAERTTNENQSLETPPTHADLMAMHSRQVERLDWQRAYFDANLRQARCVTEALRKLDEEG